MARPVLYWSLEALSRAPSVEAIVVVAPGEVVGRLREELAGALPEARVARVVAGGRTRSESVRRWLEGVPEDCEWVVVHDAARPLVTPDLVERVLEAARPSGAATAALSMTDTVKEASEEGVAIRTLDR